MAKRRKEKLNASADQETPYGDETSRTLKKKKLKPQKEKYKNYKQMWEDDEYVSPNYFEEE